MKLRDLGTAVEQISGIGPSTAKCLAKLNIFSVADLLSFYPRDYEDRTRRITLADYTSGKVHTVAKVMAHDWFGYGRMKTLKIAVSDGTASAWLVAFGRSFLERSIPEGSIIQIDGKFEVKYNSLQSTSFEVQKLADDGELTEWMDAPVPGSLVLPVYPLTEGLNQKNIRKAVASSLNQYGRGIEDEVPAHVIQSRSLLPKAQALELIHRPKTLDDAVKARRTLIYEELYQFEYKLASRTLEHRGTLPTVSETQIFEGAGPDTPNAAPYFSTPEISEDDFKKQLSPSQKKLYERLPFPLTQGQMNAISQMNRDIDRSQDEYKKLLEHPDELTNSPFSMQRLLQGDVGSGKTLTAFFMCLRTIDYKGQCALLAPTELLSRQHAENAALMLEPLGIRVAFLTGNIKASGRQNLLEALKRGDIDIVVGTHALFSRNVSYKNLQLAVIDEQHRFGVAQRESIVAKGRVTAGDKTHSPDVLMMSATPIPQTLALTVFGDLDITVIRTMPKGRKSVKTYLSVMGHEDNVYRAVKKEIDAGHQAYFVYPRIADQFGDEGPDSNSGSGSGTLKSAEEMHEFLSSRVFPNHKVALIHSKVDEEEQNRILKDFRNGTIQVLVATTVVEVGVDVPNATCIVIEHADRFGLAELHQLRGRVGRGTEQSYCFLIYGKNISEDGIQRMKALHESSDGFVIAEEDLKLRGPGQMSGTAQSGYLSLGIADLVRDKDMLNLARYDAFAECRKNASGNV
ncbi:MAG: ATP-dependent DNA helicase RecG [Treponema sp.]|nr:ATP-dependent DNA helicase RecG [Treponema sp.]MBR7079031.1 ATP-dependent DNA helicase RecG [Treponema sp.]